jgi:hypothetical protein
MLADARTSLGTARETLSVRSMWMLPPSTLKNMRWRVPTDLDEGVSPSQSSY